MAEDNDSDQTYRYEHDPGLKDIFNTNLSEESPDLDETPVPFFVGAFFPPKLNDSLIDHEDKERGNWDSQFEYILSCIGYTVGLGNFWRFPAKVYLGGGGAFLLPYITFCILVGGPMVMLEMSMGQFGGLGCSRAFDVCPLLSGIGWTIFIMCSLILIDYVIVISWCVLYMVFSSQSTLPWSVCSNSYNTPICINATMHVNITNTTYESSAIQFWNLYVTREQKQDGTFTTITDPLGTPNIPNILCIILIMFTVSLTIMFGVKITGKVVYLTVLFPFIAILQFIILGCTLPGALKGIKYYLYPNPKKLIEGHTYIMALEQLLYSCSIGLGGLITLSSFNRFRDNIYRNAFIVVATDFLTSFISGFATFPVLGYMSYRSGREISEIIKVDSNLFFITFPEALSTISNSNLWTALLMLMAICFGIDSLFVLLETVTTAIFDFSPILSQKRYKYFITISVSVLTFCTCLIFITPGGQNYIYILDMEITPFILPLSVVIETILICALYGIKNFQNDIEIMTGKRLNLIWTIIICVFGPVGASIILIMHIIDFEPLVRYNVKFPQWASIGGWVLNVIILSPIYIKAVFILVTYKRNNPDLNILKWLKLCITPPITWGPKSKRYWVQSPIYSKKLLKYKDNTVFLASFSRYDNVEKLIHLAEKQLDKTSD